MNAGSGREKPVMNVPGRQEAYWEERLSRSFDAAGTGMLAYGRPFNTWLYRVCGIRFRRLAGRLPLAWPEAEILDVGCGTGFYLRQWQRLGVQRLTGIDISPTAVERLARRHPGATLLRADLGDPDPALTPGRYQAASAMAVLFHIVAEERFRNALRNLHRALAPDGYLLLSDNFLHRPRPPWGEYHFSRTLAAYEKALEETGFTILERAPLFVLGSDPVDSESRLLQRTWQALSWCVRSSPRVGGILGGLLFGPELLLTSLLREGPSTEIMLCRKRG